MVSVLISKKQPRLRTSGTHLAIATSYTWDQGEAGLKTGIIPAIFIRKLGDEVKVGPRQIDYVTVLTSYSHESQAAKLS
jgi:hypothetical protein